jgi:hypothetical protein
MLRQANPGPGVELHPPAYSGDLNAADDAFATILQWLHSRVPYVKGRLSEAEAVHRPQPFDATGLQDATI